MKRETKATPCSTTCRCDTIPDFCGATQLSSLSGAFFLLARIPSPPVKTQDTRVHNLAPSLHQNLRSVPVAHTTTSTYILLSTPQHKLSYSTFCCPQCHL
ncbi:hypothetical protein Pmani_009861 [Petrolisthes manimaculis]|uniref:Uncharacterized protein n=1 Tax=Petrolisthes manimaculis TaxID=1843537 RepID=A0AAE1Q2M7_9EUCA|nr:hypothetical protein Pmani_009861 [Petrolisthes manimaculis]